MSKEKFMLDTNIASFIIKGSTTVRQHLVQVPLSDIYISTITEAELLLGVAKKPNVTKLPELVQAFLCRVETLPFTKHEAAIYAQLRSSSEGQGKSLSCMDMLIAAHALATDSVLVTNDKAFYHLSDALKLEDWTRVLVHKSVQK